MDMTYSAPVFTGDIDAFVAAVRMQPEAHNGAVGDMSDHIAALDLVARSDATDIAITDGSWFDPATWASGRVPDAYARVLIPDGVTVDYDGRSDASIFTLRVDGDLSFASQRDTKLVVDTMVVTGSGRLEIGTIENPIATDVQTDIVIANNGDIDLGWDPTLLSRGIISHGAVSIHGAEKTAFVKVENAPMAGETQLTLAEVPEGWQVGDEILITGTHKQGWTFGHWSDRETTWLGTEDEVVVITGIDGGTISIDRPLAYDHDTPRPEYKAYVSNMARNITVESEDGAGSDVHHRGHVMLMHNDDVDVRYAAFDHLGRTDKSQRAFDLDDVAVMTPDVNMKGRYSLHLHKTGIEDQESPIMVAGNTVTGSPGWGFVHHSSHADFFDNVAFDVTGAAFVAEAGDETGAWHRNLAVNVQGTGKLGNTDIKDVDDIAALDLGRTGDGFFFASRTVEASDNVAANVVNGFVWMTRGGDDVATNGFETNDLVHGPDKWSADKSPLQNVSNNEAFGAEVGLVVIKGHPSTGHDVRSIIDGFDAWEVRNGVDLSYVAHYTLKDVTVVATEQAIPPQLGSTGISMRNLLTDMVFTDPEVDGFQTGIWAVDFSANEPGDDYKNFFIDADISNVDTAVVVLDGKTHQNSDNPDVVQMISSGSLGESGVRYDPAGEIMVTSGVALNLAGTKTDALGSTDRDFTIHDQGMNYWNQFRYLIAEEGYFTTDDGRKVVLVSDYISDRVTGEAVKFTQPVYLDLSQSHLDWLGAKNNGPITLGGPAPSAGNDQASVVAGSDVIVDVLANDASNTGGAVEIDGLVHPRYGEIYVTEDGRGIRYVPDFKYSGPDSFAYWVKDARGNFSKAEVAISVTPPTIDAESIAPVAEMPEPVVEPEAGLPEPVAPVAEDPVIVGPTPVVEKEAPAPIIEEPVPTAPAAPKVDEPVTTPVVEEPVAAAPVAKEQPAPAAPVVTQPEKPTPKEPIVDDTPPMSAPTTKETYEIPLTGFRDAYGMAARLEQLLGDDTLYWQGADAARKLIEASLNIPTSAMPATLAFNYFEVDTADGGEGVAVFIDRAIAFRLNSYGIVTDVDPALAQNISVNLETRDQFAGQDYAENHSWNRDEKYAVSFDTTVSGDIALGFQARMDQMDEAFGIADLTITTDQPLMVEEPEALDVVEQTSVDLMLRADDFSATGGSAAEIKQILGVDALYWQGAQAAQLMTATVDLMPSPTPAKLSFDYFEIDTADVDDGVNVVIDGTLAFSLKSNGNIAHVNPDLAMNIEVELTDRSQFAGADYDTLYTWNQDEKYAVSFETPSTGSIDLGFQGRMDQQDEAFAISNIAVTQSDAGDMFEGLFVGSDGEGAPEVTDHTTMPAYDVDDDIYVDSYVITDSM